MEKAAYILLLIVLVLSILMFGAVHTYMYTLMSLGVLAATVLLVLSGLRKDYRFGVYRWRVPKNSLHAGFILLLAFFVLQMVPLPEGLLEALSPGAAEVGRRSIPAVEMPAGSGWSPLAAYGYPVRMSLIRLVVYGFFFFGLCQTLQSRRRIDGVVVVLLAAGCFEALYGLIETYSGSHHVLWYRMDYGKERLKGTFINGNHFAAFMAMGVVLAAGFAGAFASRGRKVRGGDEKRGLSGKLSALIEGDEALSKRVLIAFGGVVMGIGLVFSASRGAILSWAWAMLATGVLFLLKKGYRWKGGIIAGIFVVVCAYAIQIGVEYPLERFMRIESAIENRSRYAARTMDLFEDFRAFGVGVGNFQYAFPKYQSVVDKKKFYRYAHNDWAQYLAEAGLAGLGVLVVGFGIYLLKTLRLWKRRNDPYAVSLGVVPAAVLVYIAIHSYGEFSLHTPAIALIAGAVMAIGYAALHLERHRRQDRMNYTYYDLPLKYRGGVALVVILGLIGWAGWWSVRHFAAEAYCNTVPNSTLNRDQDPPVESVLKAIAWDGGNAEYWFKLAERMGAEGSGREGEGGGDDGAGGRIAVLEQAVRLNPFEALYHVQLGWAYTHRWEAPDYHSKWLPAADVSMDRAAWFAGVKNPRLHVEMGNYWTMRSKTVYPNDPLHQEAWGKACGHYREALRIEGAESREGKRLRKEIRDHVWNVYPDKEMMDECLGR